MCELAAGALRDATYALLTSDLPLAEQVISSDRMVEKR